MASQGMLSPEAWIAQQRAKRRHQKAQSTPEAMAALEEPIVAPGPASILPVPEPRKKRRGRKPGPKRGQRRYRPFGSSPHENPLRRSRLVKLLSAATGQPLPTLSFQAARLWLATYDNDTATFERALNLDRMKLADTDKLMRLVATHNSQPWGTVRVQATKLLLSYYPDIATGLRKLVKDGFVTETKAETNKDRGECLTD